MRHMPPAPHAQTSGCSAIALTRRALIGVAAVSAVSSASAGTRAGEPFTFGLTPVFLTSDLVLLEGLQRYLAAAMGVEVRLVLKRTYQEITSQLVAGQIDAAWICGFPFVAYRDSLHLVAVASWRGRNAYQAYLIGAAGRDATGIEDLRNDIHAFSDPDSNSGYLVTRALLAEQNSRPESFFSSSFFTYGHRNVVRAVAAGLARSGSVDGYVWEVMTETEPELSKRTRVLWKSEWMGFPPIATSSQMRNSRRIAALQRALFAMGADPVGRQVLNLLRLDGFFPAEPHIFDTIAARLATVRQAG